MPLQASAGALLDPDQTDSKGQDEGAIDLAGEWGFGRKPTLNKSIVAVSIKTQLFYESGCLNSKIGYLVLHESTAQTNRLLP
jgi:hypothetical protein